MAELASVPPISKRMILFPVILLLASCGDTHAARPNIPVSATFLRSPVSWARYPVTIAVVEITNVQRFPVDGRLGRGRVNVAVLKELAGNCPDKLSRAYVYRNDIFGGWSDYSDIWPDVEPTQGMRLYIVLAQGVYNPSAERKPRSVSEIVPVAVDQHYHSHWGAVFVRMVGENHEAIDGLRRISRLVRLKGKAGEARALASAVDDRSSMVRDYVEARRAIISR